MKKVTDKGWTVTTTQKYVIVIKKFGNRFMKAGVMVDSMKRFPNLNTKGRNHCELCNIKWIDIDPEIYLYLAFTNKGNKILCETCRNKFKDK